MPHFADPYALAPGRTLKSQPVLPADPMPQFAFTTILVLAGTLAGQLLVTPAVV
jgi:hypothetical protein